jgi:hypothetical protein
MAHGPELPNSWSAEDLAATFEEILYYLEGGGRLSFITKHLTRRKWHQLLSESRVDGRPARYSTEEIRALQARSKVEGIRNRFASRWRRAVESLGGPSLESLGGPPERAAQAFSGEIRKRLEWRATVWEPLTNELRAAGFRWDAWLAEHPPAPGDDGELTRVRRACSPELAAVVEARVARFRDL